MPTKNQNKPNSTQTTQTVTAQTLPSPSKYPKTSQGLTQYIADCAMQYPKVNPTWNPVLNGYQAMAEAMADDNALAHFGDGFKTWAKTVGIKLGKAGISQASGNSGLHDERSDVIKSLVRAWFNEPYATRMIDELASMTKRQDTGRIRAEADKVLRRWQNEEFAARGLQSGGKPVK